MPNRFNLAMGRKTPAIVREASAKKKKAHKFYCSFALGVTGHRKVVQHSRGSVGTVGQVTLPFRDRGYVALPLIQQATKDVTDLRKKVHNAVDEIFDSFIQFRPEEDEAI